PTTGAIKALGTAALAVYATAGVEGPERLGQIGVLVLATHLGNLLDLRPGRSEKALWLVLLATCIAGATLEPLLLLAPFVVAVSAGAPPARRGRGALGGRGGRPAGGGVGGGAVPTPGACA